jgi:hypothetical protein
LGFNHAAAQIIFESKQRRLASIAALLAVAFLPWQFSAAKAWHTAYRR